MNILNIFTKFCKAFPGLTETLLKLGMALVFYYHLFCNIPFFNTAFENAKGLERIGNAFLIPVHYLCEGKTIKPNETFTLKRRFQYQTDKGLYAPLALTFFTPSFVLGTTFKAIAFISPEVRIKHKQLKEYLRSTEVQLNNEYYRTLGLEINDWTSGELLVPQGYKRRPGDEKILLPDKEGLKQIITLLTKANIPFWVDCGTCIGTFRYGGVIPWDNDLDLSILINDFQNAFNILKKLDPEKFVVQNWSNRVHSGNYLRVYIRDAKNHIDIYTNTIDPIAKTLTYVIAHKESYFMSNDWKEREKRQSIPIPFEVIFPLKKGIFDGIEVPVPNQTARFISYKYGPNLNPTKIYCAETGQYEKDLSHSHWNIPLAH